MNKHCKGCPYYFYIIPGCDFEDINNGDCPCSCCIVKSMCKKGSMYCPIRQDWFENNIDKYRESLEKKNSICHEVEDI